MTTQDSTILEEAYQTWPTLTDDQKLTVFYNLDRDDEDELFLRLSPKEQKLILVRATPAKARNWLRSIEPDDLVDLLQLYSEDERTGYFILLDDQTKREVTALLAYRTDVAGGLMNTRYARLRPTMSVDEALKYLRAQTMTNIETIYYAYVLSSDQKLIGVVSLRQILTASPKTMVSEIMTTGPSLVTIQEGLGEEDVARQFSKWSFLAIPVVDAEGQMKGVLTVDDVVNVVQDAATEDIQKLGG